MFVARDSTGKVTGAAGVAVGEITAEDIGLEPGDDPDFRTQRYLKLDYLGSQGGVGGKLFEQVLRAAQEGNYDAVMLEATQNSRSYWEDKQKLSVDPLGLGLDFYGLNSAQIAERLSAPTLASVDPGMVGLPQLGGEQMSDEELEAKGVIASAAVRAREGDGAPDQVLGEDGLGRTFDALVASRAVDHTALLATAVERSHEYYGVPSTLTAGAARAWAASLPDERATDIMYHEAAAEFERDHAETLVASARQALRERVYR